jgi:hypothetical protein
MVDVADETTCLGPFAGCLILGEWDSWILLGLTPSNYNLWIVGLSMK